jgi:type II secretory pathway pseudopilin PulG
MRRQNREVNIFNMSLLDILCGALGAFCFMMLSLFPDHAKVKDLQARLQAATSSGGGANAAERARQAEQQAQQAQQQLQQAKSDQSLVYFKIAWDGPQDVDLWLEGFGGKYCTPKENLIPPDKNGKCKLADRTKGPAIEQAWFSGVARPGGWFRLFARIENRNGDTSPVGVHAYIGARASGDAQDVMSVEHFFAQLATEHQMVEMGWVEFNLPNIKITAGPKPDGDHLFTQLQPPAGLHFSPPAALDAAPGPQEQGRVDRWH